MTAHSDPGPTRAAPAPAPDPDTGSGTAPDAALRRVGPVRTACWPCRRGEAALPRVAAWLAAAPDLPPDALPLWRDARGRPHLTCAGADVNWSHSGEALLAAWAPAGRVGVDIELLRPRPKALALARRFFAAEETAALEALATDGARLEHAFTRLWCAKEALLKADGRGLSFGLEKLHFALDPDSADDAPPRLLRCDPALGRPADWRLAAWTPRPGYLATLAFRAD